LASLLSGVNSDLQPLALTSSQDGVAMLDVVSFQPVIDIKSIDVICAINVCSNTVFNSIAKLLYIPISLSS
jgi:hypothetical protein